MLIKAGVAQSGSQERQCCEAMELIVVGLHSRQAGEAALRRVDGVSDDLAVRLKDLALVTGNHGRRQKILHSADVGVGEPNLRGVRLGLLVGLAGPAHPPGDAASLGAVGGVLGGIVAGVGRDAVDNEMMRALATTLEQCSAVLLALGDEATIGALDAVTHGHGGLGDHIARVKVPPPVQSLLSEVSKLSMEDLESISAPCLS